MLRLGTIPGVLLAAAVLLAGCDQADPAAACDVEVATPELQHQRTDAGIADCPTGAGNADLPDLELACLGSDTTGSLASVEGPAVVNIWASWCGPCRKEMPALEEFHQQYGDQVDVVGVMWQDSYPEAALELAAASDVTYPSYADPCGDLGKTDLAITGAPVFFFVAADGSVTQQTGGVESVEEIATMTEEQLGVELRRGGA